VFQHAATVRARRARPKDFGDPEKVPD